MCELVDNILAVHHCTQLIQNFKLGLAEDEDLRPIVALHCTAYITYIKMKYFCL
jgi:hypothetical protein